MRNRLGDIGTDWRIILEWILQEQGMRVWTGFMWFMTGTIGGLFWTR